MCAYARRVDVGDTVELVCSTTGNPTPNLQSLGKSQFVEIEGMLDRFTVIHNYIKLSDSGRYGCRAENDAGVTTAHQDLHVYRYEDCLSRPRRRPGFLPSPPGWFGSGSFPAATGSCPPFLQEDRPANPIPANAVDDTWPRHIPLGPQRAVEPVKPPSISFNVPSVHW